MAYRNLREFIAALEAECELVRVREPVSTVLEITEICTRLLKTGGPAVLFENPVGADGKPTGMPCLANLFGTVKRVAMGVTLEGKTGRTTGAELREVGELLAFSAQPRTAARPEGSVGHDPARPHRNGHAAQDFEQGAVPGGRAHRLRHRSGAIAGANVLARRARALDHLAAHQSPRVRRPAREDDFNLGIYRMQVIGRDRTIMRWLAHRGGAQHFARWKAAGKPDALPACAVIGVDPGTILAAVTPVPDTLSGIPVRGPVARGQGRAGPGPRPSPCSSPPTPRSSSKARCACPTTPRRGRMATIPAITNSVEPFPDLPGHRHHHAAGPDLSDHPHRPAARRALSCSARR